MIPALLAVFSKLDGCRAAEPPGRFTCTWAYLPAPPDGPAAALRSQLTAYDDDTVSGPEA